MPRPPRPEIPFSEDTQIDAASAAVLLYPNRRDAAAAMRGTLAGLGLAGLLRHEPRDGFDVFGTHEVPPGVILPPPMRTIQALLHQPSTSSEELWNRRQLRLVLQAEFGVGYRRFIRSHIYPWLIEKKLIEEEETQVFSIIPASRFQPTDLGKALQARLRKLRAQAEQLPELADSDPHACAVRIIELGPGFLLASNLARYHRALASALFAQAETLDPKEIRKSSAEQRAVWVDAINPARIANTRMLVERFDAALAACDFIDNGG